MAVDTRGRRVLGGGQAPALRFSPSPRIGVGVRACPRWIDEAAGRLGDLIHRSWPDREDHESFLWQVSEHCRELHDLVAATYFDYALGESPAG